MDVDELNDLERSVAYEWSDREIIQHLTNHFRRSTEEILKVARILSVARQRFGERSRQWRRIQRSVPLNRATISKLVAVGSDDRLYSQHITPRLPSHWSTLYELTKIEGKDLATMVGEQRITPETTRSRAQLLVMESRGTDEDTTIGGPTREWIDSYYRRMYAVWDLPGTLTVDSDGDSVELSLAEIQDIEKLMDRRTSVLYTVRVDKGIREPEVRAALRFVDDLTQIEGVVVTRINRASIRNSVEKSIDHTLVLIESTWRMVFVPILRGDAISGGNIAILNRMRDIGLFEDCDRYRTEHPMLYYLRWVCSEVISPADLDGYERHGWNELIDVFLGVVESGTSLPDVPPDLIIRWRERVGTGVATNPLPALSFDEELRARGDLGDRAATVQAFISSLSDYSSTPNSRDNSALQQEQEWKDFSDEELETDIRLLERELERRRRFLEKDEEQHQRFRKEKLIDMGAIEEDPPGSYNPKTDGE